MKECKDELFSPFLASSLTGWRRILILKKMFSNQVNSVRYGTSSLFLVVLKNMSLNGANQSWVICLSEALKLPPGRTTVMHLVARETLPEPNSHGETLSFCPL